MKKLFVTISAFIPVLSSSAQDNNNFEPFKDRQFIFDTVNICAVLLVIYLISNFILRIVKQSLEFKLKNKIIDKAVSEPVIAQILQVESKKEKRNYLLQWFFVMAAIGLGFSIINMTKPFGLHSLAIMAFTIAAGFGSYYYFTLKSTENK